MSHIIILAIVEAEDEEEAFNNGQNIFEDLVERNIFDYHTNVGVHSSVLSQIPFGKNGQQKNFPLAVRVESKEGKNFISQIMNAMENEFMYNLSQIRTVLEYFSDKEVFEETVLDNNVEPERKLKRRLAGVEARTGSSLHFVRHLMYKCGAYSGSSVRIYTSSGEGIQSRQELIGALEEKNLWVVPADVHY